MWRLLGLVLPLAALTACSKSTASNQGAAASASALAEMAGQRPVFPAAPAGVLVRWLAGECSTVPCKAGECRVACPAREELLQVDVVEPLCGHVKVLLEGEVVALKYVKEISMTGVCFSVGVRPLRWPAHVELSVNDRTATGVFERDKPNVATQVEGSGPITFKTSAHRFMYE